MKRKALQNSRDDLRVRNPFQDPFVTELIEDPYRYRRVFSERILVGATLKVFQPSNIVLIGPQGSGKSMILNLIRYPIVAELLGKENRPPAWFRTIRPYFGISIHLGRAMFHVFGQRTVSRATGRPKDEALDASAAADYINHYLLLEFLKGLSFLYSPGGDQFRKWLRADLSRVTLDQFARHIATKRSWMGAYVSCSDFDSLVRACEARLDQWLSFLNSSIDMVSDSVWQTKSSAGIPLHDLANALQQFSVTPRNKIPLFVVVDQIELLKELNPVFGAELQRILNTLIKARDPVVFYKVGARTYDWGAELRVYGAESKIEVERDYSIVNLTDLLMRDEQQGPAWLFEDFARDVAYKRLRYEGKFKVSRDTIEKMLGQWDEHIEARAYVRVRTRWNQVIHKTLVDLAPAVAKQIEIICGDPEKNSPIDYRLASAWAYQRLRRGDSIERILTVLPARPWQHDWWYKERVGPALVQIASMLYQRNLYFGWETVLRLSGANITSLLILCREIWDMAAKFGMDPTRNQPLPRQVQSDGIHEASRIWRVRNINEIDDGRRRYDFVNRLGPAIHKSVVGDLALSNPGHTGFSVSEVELTRAELEGGADARRTVQFLKNAVSWATLEERSHVSKSRDNSGTRRKFYLHPLLSPGFGIPYTRVKEPYYIPLTVVTSWYMGLADIEFGSRPLRSARRRPTQPGMPGLS